MKRKINKLKTSLKVKDNSYEYLELNNLIIAKINCGFDPNNPKEKWKFMKCHSFYKSVDGRNWKKFSNSEYNSIKLQSDAEMTSP